jgi:hypothetical protein
MTTLLYGMGDLVLITTGPQIKVVVEAPDGMPPASADPNQSAMALLNSAVNARDAMLRHSHCDGRMSKNVREASQSI